MSQITCKSTTNVVITLVLSAYPCICDRRKMNEVEHWWRQILVVPTFQEFYRLIYSLLITQVSSFLEVSKVSKLNYYTLLRFILIPGRSSIVPVVPSPFQPVLLSTVPVPGRSYIVPVVPFPFQPVLYSTVPVPGRSYIVPVVPFPFQPVLYSTCPWKEFHSSSSSFSVPTCTLQYPGLERVP